VSTQLAAFLTKHCVIGPGGADDIEDRPLGPQVRRRGEVPGALLDPGKRLAIQLTDYVGSGTCGGYRHLSVAEACIRADHVAQDIDGRPAIAMS